MQQQRGFTLIELIIVIVILGILAVTAAPKFIDIQSDAVKSAMTGVKAAVISGAKLVHGKAVIESKLGVTGAVSAGGSTLAVAYGYPDGASAASSNWLDLPSEDWVVAVSVADQSFTIKDADSPNATCYVSYTEPTGEGLSPVVTQVISGC